ncbi:MAG TPA: IS66 family transposase [Casimicrobiaceae bacterium]
MDIHSLAMSDGAITSTDARVAALEAALATERAAHAAALAVAHDRLAQVTRERDQLRASHEQLRLELELLKRRIFVAKAERIDTAQLEMEFAEKLRQLDALAGTLDNTDQGATGDIAAPGAGGDQPQAKPRPTGRRNLKLLPLEEERIEIPDPLYEQLVATGLAKRIDFEESYKLAYKRGGFRRLVIARAKYQVVDATGQTTLDTAPVPPQAFPRSLAAPSLLAHIVMLKYGMGMPLFRIEDQARRDGCPIDRGTMCRWVEDAGATCGATVVHAMRQEALSASFCIATDATGVLVQPIRTHEKVRQACRRGHYFVLVADGDHVLFEYTAKETSDAVRAMFEGYRGYVQADAKSVYDILYRGPPHAPDEDAPCIEVACWAHLRRKYFEAAFAKSAVAREGLARIGRIFELDATWRHKPPADIKRLRDAHLRPHVEAFFSWAAVEYDKVRDVRGWLRSALGYAVRNKDALVRFLDDGRLLLDNNRSERALRGSIATGRKAWLFVGSDDHGQSAAHHFSLIASARLFGLDPETYLRDLYRVLPHWPRGRYPELSPKYWAATRARLDTDQLEKEFGPLTVPPPLDTTPQQQGAPNIAG